MYRCRSFDMSDLPQPPHLLIQQNRFQNLNSIRQMYGSQANHQMENFNFNQGVNPQIIRCQRMLLQSQEFYYMYPRPRRSSLSNHPSGCRTIAQRRLINQRYESNCNGNSNMFVNHFELNNNTMMDDGTCGNGNVQESLPFSEFERMTQEHANQSGPYHAYNNNMYRYVMNERMESAATDQLIDQGSNTRRQMVDIFGNNVDVIDPRLSNRVARTGNCANGLNDHTYSKQTTENVCYENENRSMPAFFTNCQNTRSNQRFRTLNEQNSSCRKPQNPNIVKQRVSNPTVSTSKPKVIKSKLVKQSTILQSALKDVVNHKDTCTGNIGLDENVAAAPCHKEGKSKVSKVDGAKKSQRSNKKIESLVQNTNNETEFTKSVIVTSSSSTMRQTNQLKIAPTRIDHTKQYETEYVIVRPEEFRNLTKKPAGMHNFPRETSASCSISQNTVRNSTFHNPEMTCPNGLQQVQFTNLNNMCTTQVTSKLCDPRLKKSNPECGEDAKILNENLLHDHKKVDCNGTLQNINPECPLKREKCTMNNGDQLMEKQHENDRKLSEGSKFVQVLANIVKIMFNHRKNSIDDGKNKCLEVLKENPELGSKDQAPKEHCPKDVLQLTKSNENHMCTLNKDSFNDASNKGLENTNITVDNVMINSQETKTVKNVLSSASKTNDRNIFQCVFQPNSLEKGEKLENMDSENAVAFNALSGKSSGHIDSTYHSSVKNVDDQQDLVQNPKDIKDSEIDSAESVNSDTADGENHKVPVSPRNEEYKKSKKTETLERKDSPSDDVSFSTHSELNLIIDKGDNYKRELERHVMATTTDKINSVDGKNEKRFGDGDHGCYICKTPSPSKLSPKLDSTSKDFSFLELGYCPIALPLGCYEYDEEMEKDLNNNELLETSFISDEGLSRNKHMVKLCDDKYNHDNTEILRPWIIRYLDEIPKPTVWKEFLGKMDMEKAITVDENDHKIFEKSIASPELDEENQMEICGMLKEEIESPRNTPLYEGADTNNNVHSDQEISFLSSEENLNKNLEHKNYRFEDGFCGTSIDNIISNALQVRKAEDGECHIKSAENVNKMNSVELQPNETSMVTSDSLKQTKSDVLFPGMVYDIDNNLSQNGSKSTADGDFLPKNTNQNIYHLHSDESTYIIDPVLYGNQTTEKYGSLQKIETTGKTEENTQQTLHSGPTKSHIGNNLHNETIQNTAGEITRNTVNLMPNGVFESHRSDLFQNKINIECNDLGNEYNGKILSVNIDETTHQLDMSSEVNRKSPESESFKTKSGKQVKKVKSIDSQLLEEAMQFLCKGKSREEVTDTMINCVTKGPILTRGKSNRNCSELVQTKKRGRPPKISKVKELKEKQKLILDDLRSEKNKDIFCCTILNEQNPNVSFLKQRDQVNIDFNIKNGNCTELKSKIESKLDLAQKNGAKTDGQYKQNVGIGISSTSCELKETEVPEQNVTLYQRSDISEKESDALTGLLSLGLQHLSNNNVKFQSEGKEIINCARLCNNDIRNSMSTENHMDSVHVTVENLGDRRHDKEKNLSDVRHVTVENISDVRHDTVENLSDVRQDTVENISDGKDTIEILSDGRHVTLENLNNGRYDTVENISDVIHVTVENLNNGRNDTLGNISDGRDTMENLSDGGHVTVENLSNGRYDTVENISDGRNAMENLSDGRHVTVENLNNGRYDTVENINDVRHDTVENLNDNRNDTVENYGVRKDMSSENHCDSIDMSDGRHNTVQNLSDGGHDSLENLTDGRDDTVENHDVQNDMSSENHCDSIDMSDGRHNTVQNHSDGGHDSMEYLTTDGRDDTVENHDVPNDMSSENHINEYHTGNRTAETQTPYYLTVENLSDGKDVIDSQIENGIEKAHEMTIHSKIASSTNQPGNDFQSSQNISTDVVACNEHVTRETTVQLCNVKHVFKIPNFDSTFEESIKELLQEFKDTKKDNVQEKYSSSVSSVLMINSVSTVSSIPSMSSQENEITGDSQAQNTACVEREVYDDNNKDEEGDQGITPAVKNPSQNENSPGKWLIPILERLNIDISKGRIFVTKSAEKLCVRQEDFIHRISPPKTGVKRKKRRKAGNQYSMAASPYITRNKATKEMDYLEIKQRDTSTDQSSEDILEDSSNHGNESNILRDERNMIGKNKSKSTTKRKLQFEKEEDEPTEKVPALDDSNTEAEVEDIEKFNLETLSCKNCTRSKVKTTDNKDQDYFDVTQHIDMKENFYTNKKGTKLKRRRRLKQIQTSDEIDIKAGIRSEGSLCKKNTKPKRKAQCITEDGHSGQVSKRRQDFDQDIGDHDSPEIGGEMEEDKAEKIRPYAKSKKKSKKIALQDCQLNLKDKRNQLNEENSLEQFIMKDSKGKKSKSKKDKDKSGNATPDQTAQFLSPIPETKLTKKDKKKPPSESKNPKQLMKSPMSATKKVPKVKSLKKLSGMKGKKSSSLKKPTDDGKVRFRLVTEPAEQKILKLKADILKKWYSTKACGYCHARMPSGRYWYHVKIHHPYRCARCGLLFTSKEEKGAHRREKHNVERYSCITCDKTFEEKWHYNKHVRSIGHRHSREIYRRAVNIMKSCLGLELGPASKDLVMLTNDYDSAATNSVVQTGQIENLFSQVDAGSFSKHEPEVQKLLIELSTVKSQMFSCVNASNFSYPFISMPGNQPNFYNYNTFSGQMSQSCYSNSTFYTSDETQFNDLPMNQFIRNTNEYGMLPENRLPSYSEKYSIPTQDLLAIESQVASSSSSTVDLDEPTFREFVENEPDQPGPGMIKTVTESRSLNSPSAKGLISEVFNLLENDGYFDGNSLKSLDLEKNIDLSDINITEQLSEIADKQLADLSNDLSYIPQNLHNKSTENYSLLDISTQPVCLGMGSRTNGGDVRHFSFDHIQQQSNMAAIPALSSSYCITKKSHSQSSTIGNNEVQPMSDTSQSQNSTIFENKQQLNFASDNCQQQNFAPKDTRQQNFTSDNRQPHILTSENRQPQNFTSDNRQPQNFTSDNRQPQNLTLENRQPQNFTSDNRQPQNFTSENRQPQNFTSDNRQPQNFTSDNRQPQNFTSENRQPQNLTSENRQPQNFTSDNRQLQNFTSENRQPQNFTSENRQLQNFTSENRQPQDFTSENRQPQNFTSDNRQPQNFTSENRQLQLKNFASGNNQLQSIPSDGQIQSFVSENRTLQNQCTQQVQRQVEAEYRSILQDIAQTEANCL